MTDFTTPTDIRESAPIIPPAPLYSGRQLARNSLYNFAGLIAPLVVGFVAIPVLVAHLGTDRFGLLSLAWMVVGYFNIFDMGIGRATTKFVAEYDAQGRRAELPQLVTNALALAITGGLVGTLLVSALASQVVHNWLNVPVALQPEALATMYVVAISIPILLTNSCARGVLEAQQRFALSNSIRVPSSVSAFLVPLLVLPFSRNLFVIVLAMTVAKSMVMVAYLFFALKGLDIRRQGRLSRSLLVQLLGYGKWVTISNVIAPMMGQMDRMLVAGLLTLTAVAYYATPFDLMIKLFIIPTGIVTVLFPVFSAYTNGHRDQVIHLHQRAVRYIMLAMLPIAVGALTLAEPFLRLWLNADFAHHSALILQIMALGVVVNSMARVPLSAIEALGRPDMTALMYLVELPLYVTALWFATDRFGISGAAAVWTIRLVVESVVLFRMSARVIGTGFQVVIPKPEILVYGALSLVMAAGVACIETIELRAFLGSILLALVLLFAWRFALSANERGEVQRAIANRFSRGEQ